MRTTGAIKLCRDGHMMFWEMTGHALKLLNRMIPRTMYMQLLLKANLMRGIYVN